MRVDITGSCLCGGVAYTAKAAATDLTACHCSQCRKTTGHHFATTNVRREDMTFLQDQTLVWYASSETAERGFCNACGASLFFRSHGFPHIAILVGSVDNTDGMKIVRHIFVADKPGYYDLLDDVPQHPQHYR